MPELREAQIVLQSFGMPTPQYNEMAALTLLALCGLKPSDTWQSAQRTSLTVSKGIMTFIRDHYGRGYAPNTRETFRRQVLHQFVQSKIADYNPDQPSLPTNSPKAHYAISEAAISVVRLYGTPEWDEALRVFKENQVNLVTQYQSAREALSVPVMLPDGTKITLSPGLHNHLQAQVIEQFGLRFASGSVLLYLGDTADKDLFVSSEQLTNLVQQSGNNQRVKPEAGGLYTST